MVLAMHGLVLEYMHRQLLDGVTLITPMPPPLLMHVLSPAKTVAPQQKPQNKRQKPLSQTTATADTVQQNPASEDASVLPSVPDGDTHIAQNSGDAPSVADSSTVEAPVQQESPAVPDGSQAAWPPDTRLSYGVKGYYRGDFYGWGSVQWQHRDGRYQVEVDMRLALLFTGNLISQGMLTADRLEPRVYEERGMGRVRRLAFDGTAVTLNDGSSVAQPLGVQDTASQFVDLTHRFASGRHILEVGSEVSVWLARPREMILWTYDVVALETLQLPELGEVPAFHLKPRPPANPRGVINAELWFAPSLQYLPVRIRVNLGNDNYAEMTVKRIEQGASPVTEPR